MEYSEENRVTLHKPPSGGKGHVSEKEFRAELVKIHAAFSKLGELIMATGKETREQFQAAVVEIEAATTAVADRIQRYIDKITAGGMSEAEEAEALAELGRVIGPLKEMGKDPSDPVPDPVPA